MSAVMQSVPVMLFALVCPHYCFFHRPKPSQDCTIAKTRLRTGGSLFLQSDTSSSFLHTPSPSPQPTSSRSVLAPSHMLTHSASPCPYVGLITWWYRISGSTPPLSCAKARRHISHLIFWKFLKIKKRCPPILRMGAPYGREEGAWCPRLLCKYSFEQPP